MTYKDPDKQREAQREWVRQKRAKKGSTKSMTNEGMTAVNEQTHVIPCDNSFAVVPKETPIVIPERGHKPDHIVEVNKMVTAKRGKDIKYFGDLPVDVQKHINETSRDKGEHTRLTGAAINYQHQHQEYEKNYHSTGAV